jgi:hypothetical protein
MHCEWTVTAPTRHHECWAEGQLLVLVEEVVGVAVEHHAAHGLQWEHILRPHLGHVKRVKVKPGEESSRSSSNNSINSSINLMGGQADGKP